MGTSNAARKSLGRTFSPTLSGRDGVTFPNAPSPHAEVVRTRIPYGAGRWIEVPEPVQKTAALARPLKQVLELPMLCGRFFAETESARTIAESADTEITAELSRGGIRISSSIPVQHIRRRYPSNTSIERGGRMP